jgi:hypothetical protein
MLGTSNAEVVGIGRHVGPKNPWASARRGSSPLFGTGNGVIILFT